MPCDSRISITLAEEYHNQDAVRHSLEAMGYAVVQFGDSLRFQKYGSNGTYSNGKITADNWFRQQDFKVNYSTEIVKQAAKKYNWRTKSTGNHITVEKGF